MIFRILEDRMAQQSKMSKAADLRFMQLALALGRRGQGRTWPNPAVGAVLVKDGIVVGRLRHLGFLRHLIFQNPEDHLRNRAGRASSSPESSPSTASKSFASRKLR